MARPLRIAFPGALYHVTSRGNARAAIFLDDSDRLRFLALLGDVVERFQFRCYAYCLMTNHYHLLVDTPNFNLSSGMRHLNGCYTQGFNRRHDRVGHVLQGRFSGILVERLSHLLELARYVVLNPVRAGLASAAEDYRWSSLRATLGLEPAPPWLAVGALLETFGSPSRYLEFVREGVGLASPWRDLQGSVLGSAPFAESLRAQLAPRRIVREIPRRERWSDRPTLDRLFPASGGFGRDERDSRVREASRVHGYALTEIARHIGLHVSTVGRIAAGRARGRGAGAAVRRGVS